MTRFRAFTGYRVASLCDTVTYRFRVLLSFVNGQLLMLLYITTSRNSIDSPISKQMFTYTLVKDYESSGERVSHTQLRGLLRQSLKYLDAACTIEARTIARTAREVLKKDSESSQPGDKPMKINYIAMDSDGTWTGFSEKPTLYESSTFWESGTNEYVEFTCRDGQPRNDELARVHFFEFPHHTKDDWRNSLYSVSTVVTYKKDS